MVVMLILYVVVLLLVGLIGWLFLYAISEAWSLWAKQGFRVRFRLKTFLIILSAACLTSAVLGSMGTHPLALGTIVLTAILFPIMLGLTFLADLLVRDMYQTWHGTRSEGMRAYRQAEFDQLQVDELGEPVIPTDAVREKDHPDRRPPRKRPSTMPINPFKMFRG